MSKLGSHHYLKHTAYRSFGCFIYRFCIYRRHGLHGSGKPIPNADKTLIKVFSYACPFCYKYDKAVTGPVSEKVKDIVAFTPFHLETKGEYGKQASEVFAVLINKDKAAGISLFDANSQFKKAKFAYYAAYHDKKNAGLTVKIRLLLSKPVWMPQV